LADFKSPSEPVNERQKEAKGQASPGAKEAKGDAGDDAKGGREDKEGGAPRRSPPAQVALAEAKEPTEAAQCATTAASVPLLQLQAASKAPGASTSRRKSSRKGKEEEAVVALTARSKRSLLGDLPSLTARRHTKEDLDAFLNLKLQVPERPPQSARGQAQSSTPQSQVPAELACAING
jgi:hypothetical protein